MITFAPRHFELSTSENQKVESEAARSMEPVLLELADHVNSGLIQCRRERLFMLGLLAIISLLMLLIFVYGPSGHWFFVLFALLLTAVLSPLWFAILLSILVNCTKERRALTNGSLVIRLISYQLRSIVESASSFSGTQAGDDNGMVSK